jgi:hypothetical protein
MGKVYVRSVKRDSMDDHIHSLPDGKETGGMLSKPSQSNRAGAHTHLYQHEGVTHETGVAFDDPGHEHECVLGETSGPRKMPAKENFGPRNDTALRIGREWVVRNDSGDVIARASTQSEAERKAKNLLAQIG